MPVDSAILMQDCYRKEVNYLRQTIVWSVITMFFMLDRLLGAAIIHYVLPKFIPTILLINAEMAGLYLALINTVFCFGAFLQATWTATKLRRGGQRVKDKRGFLLTPFQAQKLQGNQGAGSRAISALTIYTFLQEFFRRSASINGTPPPTKSPNVSNLSMGSALHDASSLSSTLGYHDSPVNRSLSTIYTPRQLDALVSAESNAVLDPPSGQLFLSAPPPGDHTAYRPGIYQSLAEPLGNGESALDSVKAFVTSYQRKSRAGRNLSFDARRGGSPSRERYGGSVSPTGERRLLRQHHESDPVRIFNRYDIDLAKLESYELKLRVWVCNTIFRPLLLKVEEINAILAEKFPSTQLRIGSTTPDQFKTALYTKAELCHTYLPFVLPYLRVHTNQNYLVQRITTLAQNVALADFKWGRGADEYVVEDYDESNVGFTRKLAWNEQLPTDSDLVWRFFCTYMDFHLSPSPLLSIGDATRPFSNHYFVDLATKPSSVQSLPSSFYVRYLSKNPPVFEFVSDGGDDVVTPRRESGNLWMVMLLLLAHVRKYNNSRLSHLQLETLCLDQVLWDD